MTTSGTSGGTRARRAARVESVVTEPSAPARASDPDPGPVPVAPLAHSVGLDPDTLTALEEQREFLLRSLTDLEREHEVGDVTDDDYESLKDDYTARAAAVIRALDSRQTRLAAARRPRSWGRIAAAVGAVVLFAVGAGALVARSSGTRGAGDAITGDVRQSTRDLLARAQDFTSQAQQDLQAGDGAAAVDAYKNAMKAYDDVLQIQPDNAEAMTYRGWLLHNLAVQATTDTATELDTQALDWLDRAVDADPGYADARVFRAILLDNAGRPQDGLADLDAIDPAKLPPYMTDLVSQRRAKIEAQLGG